MGPSSHLVDFFSKDFVVESDPNCSNLFGGLGVVSVASGSSFECVRSTLITDLRTLKLQLETSSCSLSSVVSSV